MLSASVVALLLLAHPGLEQRPRPSTAPSAAPTIDQLAGATYHGIVEAGGVVTLTRGQWQSKSRARVTLVRTSRIVGDFDGDGVAEAAVLLAASGGGSGEMIYLAVVGRRGNVLQIKGTAPVGDRVQARDLRVDGRRIVMDAVQAGKADAMCCPGDLMIRSWQLQASKLKEGAPKRAGRLSLATLAGTSWTLLAWGRDAVVPGDPKVTLQVDGDRLSGLAGCNNYFATGKAGTAPGDVTIGEVGSTRKMCAAPAMAVETRFVKQLTAARKMSFAPGHLHLTYEIDGKTDTMVFELSARP
jgi:heat shock protein HslJ